MVFVSAQGTKRGEPLKRESAERLQRLWERKFNSSLIAEMPNLGVVTPAPNLAMPLKQPIVFHPRPIFHRQIVPSKHVVPRLIEQALMDDDDINIRFVSERTEVAVRVKAKTGLGRTDNQNVLRCFSYAKRRRNVLLEANRVLVATEDRRSSSHNFRLGKCLDLVTRARA
jgi:hypothetical protein